VVRRWLICYQPPTRVQFSTLTCDLAKQGASFFGPKSENPIRPRRPKSLAAWATRQGDQMNACRTNRERLCRFLCLEKPILGAGFAGSAGRRDHGTTYNIQKAHHFRQRNKPERAGSCGLQNRCSR
jgi:hypothetical protein